MVTKGQDYILVDYDEVKQQIVNLPSRLADALLPYVTIKASEIRFLQEKEGSQISRDDWMSGEFNEITYGARAELPDPLADYLNFEWKLSDLIVGEIEHENQLHDALSQAKSVLYIASSSVSAKRIAELVEPISLALKRGVDIHILRGIKSDTESVQLISEIADKESSIGKGKIIANRMAAQSNVRFIVWDVPSGEFNAIVGSYDWLSQLQVRHDVGIRVNNQLLVAYLARHAAGLWVGTRGESLSSVPDRWRRIATGVENNVDLFSELASNKETKAKFFFTQEHFALRYKWIQQNKSDLMIASPMMTDLISPMLQKRKSARKGEISDPKLYYAELPEKYKEDLLISGGAVKVKDLSGNFIVSDNQVCVSSFNFLADVFEKKQNIKELGLTITGGNVGVQVREKLLKLLESG
jgi:hypothetical protein